MKTPALVCLVLFVALPCVLAAQAPPVAYWFQAEGNTVYHIGNCAPHSKVSFYSTRLGGKCLRTDSVDAEGIIRLIPDNTFHPAFVLNVKNLNGTGGNNKVTFFEDKEFDLEQVSAEKISGTTIISWQGLVGKDNPIAFDVMRSTDDVNYDSVAHYTASAAEAVETFAYSETFNTTASYKIRVNNTLYGQRYLTSALYPGSAARSINPATSNTIATGKTLVYPTVVKDVLHVAVNSPDNATPTYRIINIAGKMVAYGSLSTPVNDLVLSNLASGSYLIEVKKSGQSTTFPFVKQ